MTAALLFAPDAYVLDGNQIMGRRSAGAAFLRAAVEGERDSGLTCYLPHASLKTQFSTLVQAMDPAIETKFIIAGQLELLAKTGLLYRPDPVLGSEARMRLRVGPARYSLCGITHTLSSWATMEALTTQVIEPLMPWDAIICTSTVARDVILSAREDMLDYLGWLGGALRKPLAAPQFPVIPLGVHCGDWTMPDHRRQAVRSRLGLDEGEVALLFAGRLLINGKAHPFQMLEALQAVVTATGRRLTTILAGQYFTPAIEQAYGEAFRTHCPDVRLLHVDGTDAAMYEAAYGGADIFLSLADSIQETFGITPVEAMAAGLPVVVTDWNGYRDTVRDGVDGFCIPTRAPAPGAGAGISAHHELFRDHGSYLSLASSAVSVDMATLIDRLTQLVTNGDLRVRMGMAGRQRALSDYDWRVIYGRYRELWSTLGDIRRSASDDDAARWLGEAPRAHPTFADIFSRFGSYPTRHLDGATTVGAAPCTGQECYEALRREPIFQGMRYPAERAGPILAAIGHGPLSIAEIARTTARPLAETIELVANLAKMNLVIIEP